MAVRLAKEAVNATFEMPLRAGLDHERRLFYLLFGTADQKEGMDAFVNKRRPTWTCLLYTSDAADDLRCVDLGGRRIIKKKTNKH